MGVKRCLGRSDRVKKKKVSKKWKKFKKKKLKNWEKGAKKWEKFPLIQASFFER